MDYHHKDKYKTKWEEEEEEDVLDNSFFNERPPLSIKEKLRGDWWLLTMSSTLAVVCFGIIQMFSPRDFAHFINIPGNMAEPVVFTMLGISAFLFCVFLFKLLRTIIR